MQHRTGIDVQFLLRIKTAAQRGEKAADGKGDLLVPAKVDAQAFGRVRLILDGAEVVAEVAFLDRIIGQRSEERRVGKECKL